MVLCLHAQEQQTGTQMAAEACGFITIVIGTFLLHATRELDVSLGVPYFIQTCLACRVIQVLGKLSHGQSDCRQYVVHEYVSHLFTVANTSGAATVQET